MKTIVPFLALLALSGCAPLPNYSAAQACDSGSPSACIDYQSSLQAQQQWQANRAAWRNSMAVQNSIDQQTNQQALDSLMQQRAIQQSQPPINHFTPQPGQFSYPY